MAAAERKENEVSRSVSMPSSSHRREVKATTLPANSRPLSNSSGEGFFTKLKRCLRIGSKGRYNVNSVQSDQHQPEEPVDKLQNNRKIMSRATSLRVTRRAHVDKEDVILIHKSKIQSGVGLFPNRSVSDSIPEDGEQTLVHIVNGGSLVPLGQNSVVGAEAAPEVDDVFEAEMDPGYETLDEIRKKVQIQAAAAAAKRSQTAKVTINDESNHDEFEKAGVSKPDSLPETNDGSPANESSRDSGITTPTTESPESGRDGPSRSATSSMFSDTPLTEESSQPDTGEQDQNVGGVIQRLNSCPASNKSKPPRDGQRYSSDSVLTKQLQSDTDSDLYANPQILFRKQSKMGQSKSVSTSTIAVDDSASKSLSVDNRFGEKSVSDSDLKPSRGASVDSETGAPPLPDRGYLDNDARLSRTEEEHSADNDCSTSTTVSANQELSQSATHDSVASISSIREVGEDHSVCLKTPEPLSPESSSETESSSTSGRAEEAVCVDGGKPSDATTSEVIDSAPSSKASDISSLGTEICETVERTLLVSAEESTHNPDVAQTSVEDNCMNSKEACHSDIKYIAGLPDSEMCFSLDQGTPVNNSYVNLPSASSEESKYSQTSASQDSAQSVKLQEFRQDNIRCGSAVSVPDETVIQTSSTEVIAESKVLEPAAQNPHMENPLPENSSADIQTPECSDPQHSAEERDQKDSVKEASSVAGLHSFTDADSIEVVERRATNRNGNLDQTCAQNVVVIKLHESAHEDSLNCDGKAEEGVSDETIARLEQKASMLELGRGKLSPSDSSKDIDQSLQTVQMDASSSKSNECISDVCDDVKGAVGGSQDNAVSASIGDGAKQKTSSRRCSRKKEPIHMSLAELMNPRDDESMSDGNEDYQDVMEDEEEGAVAAQTNPNATTSAHRAFLESMRQLKDCGWYWGPLSYNEAVNKLLNKPDGSFLVRDSSNENYILSLSFKCMGAVCHTRIEHNKGVFSFWSQPDSHGTSTIREFVEQAIHFSHSGKFLYFLRPSGPGSPPIALRLLHPVSRFCRVQSLQHMCRFLILRWVRRDHIDVLPVPEKVKNYLRENQYYVETLEED